MASSTAPAAFADLLRQAVIEPGLISAAYSQFHNYSFGNVMLAAFQCQQRELPFGPLATFPRWKALGRHVKKGERALALCRPVTVRVDEDDDQNAEARRFTRFIFKNAWFVLAQTEGPDVPRLTLPSWDQTRALAALDVKEIAFSTTNGNIMGYARQREIAISPLSPLPHKTRFHEVAHVLLGHTTEAEQADGDLTPRDLRAVEAEAVALLCCEALGLPGADYSRGYIQNWWGAGNAIPERSAQKILKVADQILRAGRVEQAVQE